MAKKDVSVYTPPLIMNLKFSQQAQKLAVPSSAATDEMLRKTPLGIKLAAASCPQESGLSTWNPGQVGRLLRRVAGSWVKLPLKQRQKEESVGSGGFLFGGGAQSCAGD